MTTALEGVRGQLHAPDAFTPEKDPVPIVQEARRAPGPVWTGAENLAPPPPGFDPRTVRPVASRYTDYATRPTLYRIELGCMWSKWFIQPKYFLRRVELARTE